MATPVVKAQLSRPDGSVETRRFPLSKEIASSPGLFEVVKEKIGKAFVDLENKNYSLMWKDSDGDFVLMSTDEEIHDAMSYVGSSSLQVYIQVDEDKTVKMTKLTEAFTRPKEGHETQKDDEREDADKMEFQGFPSFGFPPGMMGPPPPPPPPPFPFHFGSFHWPGDDSFWGRRNHRHHHGGQGMGFHGEPMGPGTFGMRPYGGVGKRGHHHGNQGHHGQYHQRADDANVRCNKECKQGARWKAELRNAVPLLHRQWAKMFIQKWRQDNLANATTNSSDTGTDDELSMEKAGVPEAYRKWLSHMLPSWHTKWGSHKMNFQESEESDNESDKDERKLMKSSVPKEFRKWTKWYLQRHFGQRAAPRFKGNDGKGHRWHQGRIEHAGVCKTNKFGHLKKRILASLVPSGHRIWAKKFIHDWRVQRKLEGLSPSAATTSESDEGGPGLGEDVEAVPQDYSKWLEIFLPRWHRWRGLLEKNDAQEEKGGMGKFKDTVPMDFRAWVKHFLCRQYGRQRPCQCHDQGNDDTAMKKYKLWLKVFKKKWLEENQSMDEDTAVTLTSGDEDDTPIFFSSDDNSGGPETSFKRLRLSDEEEGTQARSVHFDPSSYQQPPAHGKLQEKMMKKMMKSMMESDEGLEDMEIRKGRRKHPVNHGFRKWAWQELDKWDGQSVADCSTNAQTSEPGDDADIPLHVSEWMFKVMKKVQNKKLKQEMKAAKREMKASQKMAKAEFKAARRAAGSQQGNPRSSQDE